MNQLSDSEWKENISADSGISPEACDALETPEAEREGIDWGAVRSVISEVVETIVLTLVIFFLIQTVVRNFRVVGSSMEPNLFNGQYLIIDKVSYRLGEPKRGDVVVFEPPNHPGEDYVKRVVGLPGETVEIRGGQVFVDGQAIDQSYTVRPGSYSMEARRVGENELFVLGDNRNSSSDSHTWGNVPEENVVGRAWISYWPPYQWGVITRDLPTSKTTLRYWLNQIGKDE